MFVRACVKVSYIASRVRCRYSDSEIIIIGISGGMNNRAFIFFVARWSVIIQ